MSNQRIGYSGTVLKERMNSPSITNSSKGPEVNEVFSANYADAEAAITARGYTYGDPCPIAAGAYSTATLSEIIIQKGGPKNAQITYVWKVPDPNDAAPPVGTLTLEADSNVINIPIGQHPDATSQNYDEQKKIGIGDWEGIESVLSPQPVFTRTEIISSFTFSEANIIENVAKRFSGAQMNSEGMSSASDNKWLKMQLSVGTSGDAFRKRERWQYAENGWRADLYGAAT